MKSSDIAIRRLSSGDAVTYRALRLRGLKEHPDAFTSGYGEEAAKPLSVTEARLAPEADGRMSGGFVDGAPVGAIGLLREPRAIRVGDTHFDKNHMILFLAQT